MRHETAIINTPNSNLVMTGSRPTFLSKSPMNFLIMDAPRSNNIHQYIRECKKYNVTDVVRVCDPTYSEAALTKAGIALHEMPYPDGHSPPDDVLSRWLKLVDERFVHPTNVPVPSYAGASAPGGDVGLGGPSAGGVGGGNGVVAGAGARNGSPIGAPTTTSASMSTTNTTESHHTSNNIGTGVGNSATSISAGPTIAVHCVAGLGRAPVLVAIALIEFAKMEPVDAATFIRKHRRGAINNTQLDWLERYKRRYRSISNDGCCVVM